MTEQEMLNRAMGILDFVNRQEVDRVPDNRTNKVSEAEHAELNDDDFVSLDED